MRIRWQGFELPTRVLPDHENMTAGYGRFVVEPFERGYGVTVGNSLRRALLSSIEGTAVTSIKIQGVTHEFTASDGIQEDVVDVILNVKELLLRLHDDSPVTLHIEKSGVGPVTAADIQENDRFEVINRDLQLCTITDEKASFAVEMVARKGRGYKTAEENAAEAGEQVIGVIPVDSIFSPVRRVKYHTENTRVGQVTTYDRLTLEIWTDGTISPEHALVEGSTILRKHLHPFVKYFEIGAELERREKEQDQQESEEQIQMRELHEKLALPVSVLDPSVRAENCLSAESIQTIGDLVRRNEPDMLKVRNFGKTSLKEIKKKLTDMGLSFGMEIEEREAVETSAPEVP